MLPLVFAVADSVGIQNGGSRYLICPSAQVWLPGFCCIPVHWVGEFSVAQRVDAIACHSGTAGHQPWVLWEQAVAEAVEIQARRCCFAVAAAVIDLVLGLALGLGLVLGLELEIAVLSAASSPTDRNGLFAACSLSVSISYPNFEYLAAAMP